MNHRQPGVFWVKAFDGRWMRVVQRATRREDETPGLREERLIDEREEAEMEAKRQKFIRHFRRTLAENPNDTDAKEALEKCLKYRFMMMPNDKGGRSLYLVRRQPDDED